ncbi:MAG: hypothetical protein ABEI52_00600, partial [Halobacteriaceae archaeon]
ADVTAADEYSRRNMLTEQALLDTTSTDSTPGIIEATIQYELTTTAGSVTATVTVSHLGATKRHGTVENQLTENRYSNKELAVTAGNVLSARYTSAPLDMQRTTKRDQLRIDNSVTTDTIEEERERSAALDEKRRRCLDRFVHGYTHGEANRNNTVYHELSTELFLKGYMAVV